MQMSPELFEAASNLIRKHEGKRLKLYFDPLRISALLESFDLMVEDLDEILSEGQLSIGYGYNLSANGLPGDVIEELLFIKLNQAHSHLLKYPWYPALSVNRAAALLDMVYELGGAKFDEFTHMLEDLALGDFGAARICALDSAWAREVPARAADDAALLIKG